MHTLGFKHILKDSAREIAARPVYWLVMLIMPIFSCVFFTDLLSGGLPTRIPAAVVDEDCSQMSRSIVRQLDGMQMVEITEGFDSYTEAKEAVQRGEIFGFFMIPSDFQSELLAGRSPEITYYTNMTYYVPASLLYKSFKTVAVYTKAAVSTSILTNTGIPEVVLKPILQPVPLPVRAIGNPQLHYGVYLCNSFVPAMFQLLILLMTSYSMCSEIKSGHSRRLMHQADGSIIKAVSGKLLPQTMVWIVMIIFMESWLYGWNSYPMHGSMWWLTLSNIMFVFASQGLALFIVGLLPNLRLSLSVSALLGVLTFSIGVFSFPYESMYGAIGIFTWIVPSRYNFLIYIDQGLYGSEIAYSGVWYAAYIVFIILPISVLWRLKKAYQTPVYVP